VQAARLKRLTTSADIQQLEHEETFATGLDWW